VPANITSLCDRNFGVGCDQLMVYKNIDSGIDLQIFNQDGSVADMCGNGLRCIAGLYFDENLDKSKVEINILPNINRFLPEI
jgi:diaminopimelate epimerase